MASRSRVAIAQRIDTLGRVILDNAPSGRVSLPAATPSGSGGAGTLAVIGANVAALGPGVDGKPGVIKVGTWPDVEYVELVYDGTVAKWVGKPRSLIQMTDQSYMGVNSAGYTYISLNATGGGTGPIGWTTRAIRKANLLLAAGLKLQARFAALVAGSTAPATITVMPFFFQNDDNETVVSSTDGSSGVAWLGTPIVSPNTAVPTFKSPGWQDVLKNGLGTVLAAADVTKANLWPRLYGKVASGAAYGTVIDADLQFRWVSV